MEMIITCCPWTQHHVRWGTSRVAASGVLVAAGNVKVPSRSAIFRPWEQQPGWPGSGSAHSSSQRTGTDTSRPALSCRRQLAQHRLVTGAPLVITAGLHARGELREHRLKTVYVRQHLCFSPRVSAVWFRPIVHSKLFCAPVWKARLNAPLPTTRPRWFEVCSGCERPPTCRDLVRLIK